MTQNSVEPRWGDFLESTLSRNLVTQRTWVLHTCRWTPGSMRRWIVSAALGFIHTGYAGMRPWTRMECARLLEEAAERVGHSENSEVSAIYEHWQLSSPMRLTRIEGRAKSRSQCRLSLQSIRWDLWTALSETRITFSRQSPTTTAVLMPEHPTTLAVLRYGVAGPLSIDVQAEYQHSPAVASDPCKYAGSHGSSG